MILLKPALKLLWRDSRAGELTLLCLALLIAVTSSTAISLFADRLQRTMTGQAAEFLAADLIVAGSSEIPVHWLEQAGQLHLDHSQTCEFPSVLLENGQMLLAAVKAVSNDYPLRGFLKTVTADYANETRVINGPVSGTVWVEKRVLSALNLNIGDTLTIGEKLLTIGSIISYEPDKRGDFYSFSPRVMMNVADLAATGVIQPGSHVHYFYQFRGSEPALTAFKNWLKPQINPSQRIMDIHDDRPELGLALSRAQRYLGLSSVVVIVIAGIAIAMATHRYSERHFNATALLRCLGCRQADIVRLYAYQFLAFGMLVSGLGCGLGWLAQQGLFYLLRELLPPQVAAPGWLAVVFGLITGMVILFGFALPPLLRLKQVSALQMLRRELQPLPGSGWLVYGLALAIVGVLIWHYTEDFKLTAVIMGVGLLVLLALALLLLGLLRLMGRYLSALPLTWRFGMNGLIRHEQASVAQILAFGITLTAMVLSFNVRNELIDSWQQQLPAEAPNHFALNIVPEQQTAFAKDLQQAQIISSHFYPIVRGRLVAINDIPVQQRVSKDSQGEAATQRELSLTWGQTIPQDNVMTAGQAWPEGQVGWVSVEQKLADNLKIRVGDRLSFTVGSAQLHAKVANLRSVQWETMRPNFYMVFSPGTLDAFPGTLLTSFYLPETRKNLLNDLVKRYPAVTILEVDLILKQFKTILVQLTSAINYLLYFALLAGLTVLFAAVYSTLDARIHESALMRTLGAHRALLRKAHLIEFGMLGLLAGLLAAIAGEAILFALYSSVLHIDYHPSFQLWLLLPGIGVSIVELAGFWGVRKVVTRSPLQVLR